MANYYPPVGFHFRVEVLGLTANANDVRFTEVSGLSVEMGTEEIAEGAKTVSSRNSRSGPNTRSWC